METALETALEAGYRHIDTAAAYENEHVIGKVLNKWIEDGKLTRDELFIVTKVTVKNNFNMFIIVALIVFKKKY